MKYLCNPRILPTNTSPSDLSELARRTEEFSRFATEIQLDIADGVFAPVVSWPYQSGQWQELERLAQGEKLPLSETVAYEAHLMAQEPLEIGVLLAKAGCQRLIFHIEATGIMSAREMTRAWKDAGAKEVGVSLLVDTPLEAIDDVIGFVDVVQLMSIPKIGAQGQPFDERTLSRVEELHAKYPDMMVAVDGGISESNIELLVRAGANRLCVGSAISNAMNKEAAFATLFERAMRGCAPQSVSEVL
jgi:ribulose-phosphate 3-epimerase